MRLQIIDDLFGCSHYLGLGTLVNKGNKKLLSVKKGNEYVQFWTDYDKIKSTFVVESQNKKSGLEIIQGKFYIFAPNYIMIDKYMNELLMNNLGVSVIYRERKITELKGFSLDSNIEIKNIEAYVYDMELQYYPNFDCKIC